MADLSDILIARQEDIRPEFVGDFISTLSQLGIPYQHEETERRIYSALEYYIPTALLIFLAKPFFDGFLKKAGEDSYAAFRRALASLVVRTARVKVHVVTSGDYKIQRDSPFSRIISVYCNSASGLRLKFLMPSEISEEASEQLVGSLLAMLRDHYTHSPADELSRILGSAQTRTLTLLCYDDRAGEWRLFEQNYGFGPKKT
jgi:hypothetical protein